MELVSVSSNHYQLALSLLDAQLVVMRFSESTRNSYRFMFRDFLKYVYPKALHQL